MTTKSELRQLLSARLEDIDNLRYEIKKLRAEIERHKERTEQWRQNYQRASACAGTVRFGTARFDRIEKAVKYIDRNLGDGIASLYLDGDDD